MFEFKNIELLWILVLVIPMFLMVKNRKSDIESIFKSSLFEKIKLKNSGLSQKSRALFFIGAFALLVIAFARPVINNGEIKVKSSFINMVVAIDMSKSMFANDVYPSRFDFAKKKFIDMMEYLKNTKVSLMGFSSQTFLISPLTEDFHSLKFLTTNLTIDHLSLKGTDILNTLKTANELMEKQENKILFLFTDGADNKDFKKELAYAKEHHITLYIYGIGTLKGGVINTPNGALKDKNGNIVVVKLNEKIKTLALQSGGAYMRQTLEKDDIKMLVSEIQSHFKAKNDSSSTIKDEKELFVIPLAIGFLLLMISFFSLPKRKGVK
ncbi:TPR domain protein in aerotolerance operon [hydrothermal vent metagenome]|uniref:TPR domain protein in aerotolerance operon n=1 Tax=hydrothermal vent metagenome TaxID=652676 RepID=A0A1W1C645_9ZZZZ